jgi:hypothetical protein
MSRARRLVTTILPSAIAGGLLFGSAFGHASAGDDAEPAFARRAPATRTADARRVPPLPPAPPAPPAPPMPPLPPGGWSQPPPMPGQGGPGGRFSISIRNGKVHIEGLEGFARHHLESVREMIRNNPNIPPDVRDKVLARLDTARAIIERRLRNLSSTDLDKIGDEMEKMGDELEKAMEGLEDEMGKLGEKLSKDFAKKLGKDLAKGLKHGIQINGRDRDQDRGDGDDGDDGDDDSDDDRDGDHARAVVIGPDVDVDTNTRGAIRDLPDLTLRPAQREQIVKLRSSYEQEIARARKQLDDASKRLEIALADLRTSDADIERYVDQVSRYEAAIRKARLLTWVNARRLLDETQRKKIEDATGKRHR